MDEINWDECVAGPYGRYDARAKATTLTPRADGQVLVTLWGGEKFIAGHTPAFRLEYEGVAGTYQRDIDILDLSVDRPWLFDAWYPVAQKVHTYAFRKVVGLTEIATGERISGKELCRLMGGTYEGRPTR